MTGRRIALVGAGLAARPWLEALADLGEEVVVVATRSAERYETVARYFPAAVQVWPPREAVETPGVTVCICLTPPSNHLECVQLAAQAGVPVIVEKPLETTVHRAAEAAEVARRAGVPLAVCLQYRYQEGALALRRLVDDGALGRIRAATLDVAWWRPTEYYREPGRGTYARDGGGVLITQAIHALDLLIWYLGMPAWVSAELGRGAIHDIEAEDVAMSLMGYDDATMASMFATTGSRSAEEVTLRILGTDATAVLVGNRLMVHDGTGAITEHGEPREMSSRELMGFPSRWHRAFLADTFEAFDSASPPPVGGPEALAALSVIDAIERSAKRGERVAPELPGGRPG